MELNNQVMEIIGFFIMLAGGFYKLTKIENNILGEIKDVNGRLDIHLADHKLIDHLIVDINKKLDN